MQHCSDNEADRALGKYWERQFCLMAARLGYVFSPLQIGKETSAVAYRMAAGKWNTFTLPDITIWTAPGQHHEIKHKNPAKNGCFGLEQYRFDALLDFAKVTGQSVMYTIHNHDLSGGRGGTNNDVAHWFTADVEYLDGKFSTSTTSSWVNGKRVNDIVLYYWATELWQLLATFWSAQPGR